jgi:hypothetical protein
MSVLTERIRQKFDPRHGMASHHDLRKTAIDTITLHYTGRYTPPGMSRLELEVEIYEVDRILSVHALCPKCGKPQWIDGRRKNIVFDSLKPSLHVEPFTCPWEMETERHRFGIGLCKHRMVYEGLLARDA